MKREETEKGVKEGIKGRKTSPKKKKKNAGKRRTSVCSKYKSGRVKGTKRKREELGKGTGKRKVRKKEAVKREF